MSPPRPALRQLARRLLEEEAGGQSEPAVVGRAAEEVLRRLRDRLVTLVGARGFEALLRRALTLAEGEIPELERVRVAPGGGVVGLPSAIEARTEGEATAGPLRLLGHFFELLATFIGEDLTARLAAGIQRAGDDPHRASEET